MPQVFTSCPGLYCGRSEETNWTECTACPRGYRVNSTTSICEQCTQTPTFYSWLFLGFMAMLPLILHWFCIDVAAKRRRRYRPCDTGNNDKACYNRGVIILHLSALVETVFAACLTVLACEPRWKFDIHSCPVLRLSDWYTMLHNPSPGYDKTLHCTQEAVYPLYTIVLMYYALCIVIMMLLRPMLASKFLPGRGKASVYAALYFLPMLVVLQAACGGLLYYSFPYITIILSVFSNAAHFAFQLEQSVKTLVRNTVTDVRNLAILFGHWILHAYGIIAVTELLDLKFHLALIALVPFPTVFYVLTARCTDPNKLHLE